MTQKHDLSGRYALITGASRGIGRSAATALAKAGAHIIAIARTTGALEELDDEIKQAGGSATLIPADITDQTAMEQLRPILFSRFGRLDIFIANAGILGELSPVEDIDPKIWNNVLAVNLTAQWQMTAALDPLLRQSDHGRVVYLSTSLPRTLKPFWGAYTVSKAGLEALAGTYANEVKNSKIRVNILDPGPIRTRMRAQAMPGEDPNSLPHPDELAALIVAMSAPSFTDHGSLVEFSKWRKQH